MFYFFLADLYGVIGAYSTIIMVNFKQNSTLLKVIPINPQNLA
jgi:hypothetical protein